MVVVKNQPRLVTDEGSAKINHCLGQFKEKYPALPSSGKPHPRNHWNKIFLIALSSMDSFQFWLYVIVAIIYLVSKAMQKDKRRQPPTPKRQDPDAGQETEQLPPLTFEELLREITEGKKRRAEPPQPPKPVPPPPVQSPVVQEYVDYDDELEEEEKSLERVDYDREREAQTLQVYERAKREVELKSSLGTLKSGLRGIESSLGTTTRGKKRHWLLQEYVRELKTPSGFRKAVVMSEILKPKF